MTGQFPDACSVGLFDGSAYDLWPLHIVRLSCQFTTTDGSATKVVEALTAEPNTRDHYEQLQWLHYVAWELSNDRWPFPAQAETATPPPPAQPPVTATPSPPADPTPTPETNYVAEIAELTDQFPDDCYVGWDEGTSADGRTQYILWLHCEAYPPAGITPEFVERVIAYPNTRAHYEELQSLHEIALEWFHNALPEPTPTPAATPVPTPTPTATPSPTPTPTATPVPTPTPTATPSPTPTPTATPAPTPTPEPNYAAAIAELAREFPDACSVGLFDATSRGEPGYILWLRCEPTATGGGAAEVVERAIAEPNTHAHFEELNDLHQLAWELFHNR